MPLMRIILPLAVAAAFLFAPLVTAMNNNEVVGVSEGVVTGGAYVGPSVDCVMSMQFNPMAEGCTPNRGLTGWVLYAAVALGVIAAIIGVLGLLPFLSGISGFFTMLAGAVGLGAAGMLAFQYWQMDKLPDVQWGLWAALGAAILTFLVGISTMSSGGD